MSNQIILSPQKDITVENKLMDQFAAALDLKVRAHEFSKDTSVLYLRGAKRFVEWRKTHNASQNLPDAIREWKAYMLNDCGNKPSAVNAWMSGVRSFFAWTTDAGITAYNPILSIRGATRKGTKMRHQRESLTDTEAKRLLDAPGVKTIQAIRDSAIISVLLFTAARGIELHRADLADLRSRDGRLVLYIQGKGHDEKDDFVVVSHAEDALRDWLGVRNPKATALFHSLSNRNPAGRLSMQAYRALVKHYMYLAGVQGNKTTHSLRHTAITKAITAGVPLHKVSKGLARHASMDTTLIYVHELDRISDPAEDHITY